MSSVDFDMSEVRAYVKDLTGVPAELSRHVLPVLKRGAQNVKTAMQADLRESSNAGIRYAARGISYDDPVAGTGGWEVEIGPEKPVAAIAAIAYFGGPKGGGHTRDPLAALEDEAPNLDREIGKMIGGLRL